VSDRALPSEPLQRLDHSVGRFVRGIFDVWVVGSEDSAHDANQIRDNLGQKGAEGSGVAAQDGRRELPELIVSRHGARARPFRTRGAKNEAGHGLLLSV
jgi:hypothetical protein